MSLSLHDFGVSLPFAGAEELAVPQDLVPKGSAFNFRGECVFHVVLYAWGDAENLYTFQ